MSSSPTSKEFCSLPIEHRDSASAILIARLSPSTQILASVKVVGRISMVPEVIC